jgi:hypothetical protein
MAKFSAGVALAGVKLLVWACVVAACIGTAGAAGLEAVVQLDSHGASGTIVKSTKQGTWILTCAHAFEGQLARKPITLQVPAQGKGQKRRGTIRLVRLDRKADLALVHLSAGPLPNVCPLAAELPEGECVSAGYDDGKRPVTSVKVNIRFRYPGTFVTDRAPWHGRSGGPLLFRGRLVGVVRGYTFRGTCPWPRGTPRYRQWVGRFGQGDYVSLDAIRVFLAFIERQQGRGDGFDSFGSPEATPYPAYPGMCPN